MFIFQVKKNVYFITAGEKNVIWAFFYCRRVQFIPILYIIVSLVQKCTLRS